MPFISMIPTTFLGGLLIGFILMLGTTFHPQQIDEFADHSIAVVAKAPGLAVAIWQKNIRPVYYASARRAELFSCVAGNIAGAGENYGSNNSCEHLK